MVKAATPIVVLIMSILFKLESLSTVNIDTLNDCQSPGMSFVNHLVWHALVAFHELTVHLSHAFILKWQTVCICADLNWVVWFDCFLQVYTQIILCTCIGVALSRFICSDVTTAACSCVIVSIPELLRTIAQSHTSVFGEREIALITIILLALCNAFQLRRAQIQLYR